MSTVFTIFWLTCSAPVMGMLGFWIGRCARKIPIIDNNLPWAMRHHQLPQPARSENTHRPPPEPPCCDDHPDRS
jgi:hypothetical protein